MLPASVPPSRPQRQRRRTSPAAPSTRVALLLAVLAWTTPLQVAAQAEGAPASARGLLSSPRATMSRFFGAFREARQSGDASALDAAADALDLSGVPPALRSVKGRELAILLKDVLDRTRRIDVERLPTAPEGPSLTLLRRPEGTLVLERQQDGQWRFSAASVAALPALAAALEGTEVVEGVVAAPRFLSPALWLRARVPSRLRRPILFLEGWQWLGLLALVLVGVMVERALTLGLAWIAGVALARRRVSGLQRHLLLGTSRPLGLVGMAALWWLALPLLGLPLRPLEVLSLAITFLVATGFVWAAYRAVDILAAILERRAAATEGRFDDLLVPLVRKSLKVFIAAVGLVFVAGQLNLEVTSLIAGLGIGGLALALAAQDAVKNLFGSLLVLLDRPFQVGDWIVAAGAEGTVEELGFRSTRIRTFSDSLITLPNANLINSAVENFGARRFRRWKTTLSLTYDTPPDRIEAFCEGLRQLVVNHPQTRKEGFHIYLTEFGPSSLDVLLYLFFETRDWASELAARHHLALEILRLAERLGVEFAFPTRTVHLASGPTGAGGAQQQ